MVLVGLYYPYYLLFVLGTLVSLFTKLPVLITIPFITIWFNNIGFKFNSFNYLSPYAFKKIKWV
jgi:hypothetical protein